MLKLTNEQFSIARSLLVTMNDKFRTEAAEYDLQSDRQEPKRVIAIHQILKDHGALSPSAINIESIQADLLLLEQLKELLMLNEALSKKLIRAIVRTSGKTYANAVSLFGIIEIIKESDAEGVGALYDFLSGIPDPEGAPNQ